LAGFAASGVFLLIVWVNASGLLLAHCRAREFEMRAAGRREGEVKFGWHSPRVSTCDIR
jgi:hypothetical protein